MLVGQETTFIQSILYLIEKKLECNQLLFRFLTLTRSRQPTLRQLIHGLSNLEIPSNLSLLIQISFLISVSNLSYMSPCNNYEAENLINAVVRILKKETLDEDDPMNQNALDSHNPNPWILSVSCQFLSRFSIHLNSKSDSYNQQILFVYLSIHININDGFRLVII